MRKYISKIKIMLFDLLPSIEAKPSKNILLVFAGVIGDSVLFCDFLRGFRLLYPEKQGYIITIYTTNNASVILQEYTQSFNIVSVDFKRLNIDYKYHRKVMNKLTETNFDMAINPFPAHSDEADSIMVKCSAQKKMEVVNGNGYKLKWFERIINNKIKEKIKVSDNLMELQKYAEVVRYMGLTQFKSSIPKLIHSKFLSNRNNYCVLAVGGSTPCKRWPPDRFAQIANYIIEKIDCNIYVCGGKGEEHIFEEMKKYIKYKNKVHSYIGKTTLINLVEMINEALLLIGNDSSSIHIATAVQIPSICIVGGWDYGRMYPYKVDEVSENDILPIVIDVPLECFGCSKVRIGHGNKECKSRVVEQKVYPCIDGIKVEDVYSAIEKVLNNI